MLHAAPARATRLRRRLPPAVSRASLRSGQRVADGRRRRRPRAWIARDGARAGAGGHLVYSDFHPSWAQQRLEPHLPRPPTARRTTCRSTRTRIDDHLARARAAGLARADDPRAALRATTARPGDQGVPPPLGQPAGRRRVSRGESAVIWANAVSFVNARVRRRRPASADVDPLRRRAIARRIGERPQRATTVVDLDGAFVLPGLVNAHDHLELNHYGRAQGPRSLRQRLGLDRRHAAAARRGSGDSRAAARIR